MSYTIPEHLSIVTLGNQEKTNFCLVRLSWVTSALQAGTKSLPIWSFYFLLHGHLPRLNFFCKIFLLFLHSRSNHRESDWVQFHGRHFSAAFPFETAGLSDVSSSSFCWSHSCDFKLQKNDDEGDATYAQNDVSAKRRFLRLLPVFEKLPVNEFDPVGLLTLRLTISYANMDNAGTFSKMEACLTR